MSASGIFAKPSERIVQSWDAVEYQLPDGRIHRGRVVDVIEHMLRKELLVDQLLGQSPPSEILVPRHKALRFEARPYLVSRYPKHADTVQILLQMSPSVPWTWFPGKLILSDYRSFAVVQVHGSETQPGEIVVSAAHVRFDHPEKFFKRIGRNDFVKKIVKVPEKFVLDEEVRKRWKKRFPRTKPCTLSNSSLSYLQAAPKSKENKLMKINATMIGDLMDEVRMNSKESVSNKNLAYYGPCIHHILPKEIMLKIFKLLYTEQQAKARCVCQQWNIWLRHPVFLTEARFDLCGENRYLRENDCLRKFLAYIYGILAPNCKSVVLTAGNGNVVRRLLVWDKSSTPCLFDRLLKLIASEFSCSSELPKRDTNYPNWSTIYTLTRGGIRWSFELVIDRIYSYHGPNENALEPTVFPDDFQLRPGLPIGLKPYTILSDVPNLNPVCMSNPTGFVFAAGTFGDAHLLTWDILNKGQYDKPVPSYHTRCFENDYLAQLKLSADGTVLFAGGGNEIAVLDVCEGVPQVKTLLRNPGVPPSYGRYYTCRCPMAVSPDGNLCFVSCATGYIIGWDVRSGKVVAQFREPPKTEASRCIDRSSDGLTLWTGGTDKKLRCLDIRTLTQLREMDMKGLGIYDISCCPDNKWIAVGTKKKFSYIDTFEEWQPGGQYIRQSSVVVEIINVTKPEEYLLEILDKDETGVLRYSPNGDWLLATTDMELSLFHHPYGYLAYKEYMNGSLETCYYGGCDISPDGKFVAKGMMRDIMVYEVIY